MFVNRETNIPYIEALSFDECFEEVALKELTASESGIKVIEALQEIINDLDNVPDTDKNAILGDVSDLLCLISYFIQWPLLVGRQAYTILCTRGGKKKISDEQSRYEKAYKDLWDNLCDSTLLQLNAWGSQSTQSTLLLEVTKHDKKVEIPRLGAIELLLRIVAESGNSNDIQSIHTRFKGLQVSQLADKIPEQRITGYRGIPSVVALCYAQQLNDNSPNCVITTTTDVWTGFPSMHAFLKEARRTRQNYSPFAAHKDDLERIANETRYLYQRYPKNISILGAVSGQGSFCHQDFSIRALSCPQFDLKSRCIRCQGLFNYHIEPDYGEVEYQYRMFGSCVVNDETSCAEVYAHFYCKQASSQGNWVKTLV